MITVVVVDDQALVRSGFRLILDVPEDIHVVGEAGDGASALAMVAELRPDVVLMDLRMPVMDGIEATRRISKEYGDVRVLVLTTFDGDSEVYAAVTAGASGFLLKDVSPADLAYAIRVVADGQALVASSITRRLLAQYTAAPPLGVGPRDSRLDGLTPRETDVVRLVAQGMNNTEIAEQLYLSPATVKTHVGAVFAKLKLRDRAQAVVFAYESGLVRPGE